MESSFPLFALGLTTLRSMRRGARLGGRRQPLSTRTVYRILGIRAQHPVGSNRQLPGRRHFRHVFRLAVVPRRSPSTKNDPRNCFGVRQPSCRFFNHSPFANRWLGALLPHSALTALRHKFGTMIPLQSPLAPVPHPTPARLTSGELRHARF